ncbi:MAG: acyl carrier protein [Gammaproteobacteria bacterium]|nr:acyl carrier protein [Desulfuromonadales bacterium]NIT64865.1 acyl carrier protein [Gammaproteobacteria bacterium]NIY33445.1 acyl carrier protein [Gammaproteobacteria bacterium]
MDTKIDEGFYSELRDMVVEACQVFEPVPENVSPDDPLIGPDSPFGLDSLDAVELVVAVQKKYDVRIGADNASRKVLESFRTLAEFIRREQAAG